ncbi:MAG: DnaJ C-terminal domain-containing protein [Caulobacteraceae bacterium]
MAQDLYSELGVSRSTSADDMRKAFRKLAKDLHPDRNPNDKAAEERFKRVSAAFDILGDPEKRTKYDNGEIDADGREVHRGYQGGGNGGAPFGQGGGFEGVDLDEIFGGMFSGRGRGGKNFAMRGSDVQARLDVDLEEIIKGATRRISFGDGRTLDVTIPKGAANGQTLRLRGQGYPGRGGGAAGDALIELAIRPHPVFRMEGADLHMDLPVAVPDAVLGAKVDAPTPEGPVALTVPRHSNSGSVLRLRGRGGFDSSSGKRGDLFAHLVITLPDRIDAELEHIAETWRRERPYTPPRR